MKFSDLRKLLTIRKQIEDAERSIKITQDAYVAVTVGLANIMTETLEIQTWNEDQKQNMARYNKREQDLRTLEKMIDLIQSVKPDDKQTPGEETKYISAINEDGHAEIGKLIEKIVKTIKKDY